MHIGQGLAIFVLAAALYPECGHAQTASSYASAINPYGLAVDGANNLYASTLSGVPNNVEGEIQEVPAGGGSLITIASGQVTPTIVALHGGNLYESHQAGGNVADSVVSQITLPAGTVTTYTTAGMPTLNNPAGLAFDGSGNLYVADNGDGNIYKFPAGGGDGQLFATLPGGAVGLVFDGTNFYAASTGIGVISKITLGGTVSTFLSGTIATPAGLVLDGAGNVFVSDQGQNIIYRVTPAAEVSVYYSGGLLNAPVGLAFDGASNLYVANNHSDTGVNGIIRIAPPTAHVPTLSGWATILMGALIAGSAIRALRRRSPGLS
jgi:streptogramin lyase